MAKFPKNQSGQLDTQASETGTDPVQVEVEERLSTIAPEVNEAQLLQAALKFIASKGISVIPQTEKDTKLEAENALIRKQPTRNIGGHGPYYITSRFIDQGVQWDRVSYFRHVNNKKGESVEVRMGLMRVRSEVQPDIAPKVIEVPVVVDVPVAAKT